MKVDFGPETGGEFEFDSVREFLEFLHEQANSWSATGSMGLAGAQLVADIRRRFSHVIDAISEIGSEEAASDFQNTFDIETGARRPILLASPFGEKLYKLLSSGQNELVQSLLREFDSEFEKSYTFARIRSLLERYVPSSSSVVKLSDEFQNTASLLRKELGLLEEGMGSLSSAYEQERLKIKDAKSRMDDEWKSVLDAYNEKLNLDKTSTLWKKRSEYHGDRKNNFSKLVAISGVASLAMTVLAAYLFFHFSDRFIGSDDPEFASHRTVFASAGTLLVLTLGLWATRIFVRLYMTEHHLEIDAESRSALGDTYVSLLADGQAAIEDRQIVLATLFRPVVDGIVSDDGMPAASPAALLAGVLAGGKTGGK